MEIFLIVLSICAICASVIIVEILRIFYRLILLAFTWRTVFKEEIQEWHEKKMKHKSLKNVVFLNDRKRNE